MQNVSTAKLSKTSEALGGFEPPISRLQDRRINCYATESGNIEVSKSTLPDKVWSKKPKEPMTTNSMQNAPGAKYSNITGAIGQIRTTDSCLQDKRYNHYAREPNEREETEVKHLILIKFKNNENKGGTYIWSIDHKITSKDVCPGRTRTTDLLFMRQAH